MAYNPDEPRNAQGEWSNTDEAIQKAASDKKTGLLEHVFLEKVAKGPISEKELVKYAHRDIYSGSEANTFNVLTQLINEGKIAKNADSILLLPTSLNKIKENIVTHLSKMNKGGSNIYHQFQLHYDEKLFSKAVEDLQLDKKVWSNGWNQFFLTEKNPPPF